MQWGLAGRTAAEAQVASSRPTPEALKKVDAALAAEQKEQGQAGTGPSSGGHGFGMGNALMMYWLLSGNRGMFWPRQRVSNKRAGRPRVGSAAWKTSAAR